MTHVFLAALGIFLGELTSANTLDHLVRSYPCPGGKSLGLYISDMTGIQTVEAYCDFKTLRGFSNSNPYSTQSEAIAKKCVDEDSDDWVKECYKDYQAQCFETKDVFWGYGHGVKTYIKQSCINEKGTSPQTSPSGGNAVR